MESMVKQRLTGSIVLVSLVVIFLPLLLDGGGIHDTSKDLFEASDSMRDPMRDSATMDNETPVDVKDAATGNNMLAPPPAQKEPRRTINIEQEDKPKTGTTDKTNAVKKEVKKTINVQPKEPKKEIKKTIDVQPEGTKNITDSDDDSDSDIQPVRKWDVQLATYIDRNSAEIFASRVDREGFQTVVKVETGERNRVLFVVVLRMESTYDEVKDKVNFLDARFPEIKGAIIRRRR